MDRFITSTGLSTNDGLTELTAWSLEHAVTQDIYPDRYVMKSGDYGNKQVTIDIPNTKIIGYQTTPDDIVSSEGSTYVYPAALNVTDLPTITGDNQINTTAFNITASNVQIENIQFQSVDNPIFCSGFKSRFKNIIIHTIGTINHAGSEFNFYDGRGVDIRGDKTIIENCTVVNAASEGIKIVDANDGIIRYCKVYSDIPEAQDGTDYYIQILRGDNNLVEYCHVEKAANDSEVGRHGFVIKWAGTGNIIRYNTTKRLNIEAQFVAVTGNYFVNNILDGDYASSGDLAARARIANGAHHNYFIGNRYKDCYAGVSFADWDDGATADTSLETGAGNDNYSINEVFENVENVIFFDPFSDLGDAVDNYIINPTIVNCTNLFRTFATTRNSGTKVINALIHNTPNFAFDNDSSNLNTNTQFENIVLSNSFNANLLTGFLESNIEEAVVVFVDAVNGDYTPTTDIFNTGQDASLIISEAKKDINDKLRIHYTLGAFNQGESLSNSDWSGNEWVKFLI
mgnify:CR=1 FL=1